VAAALLVGSTPAHASRFHGSLTQLSGGFGCVSDGGTDGCASGRALRGAASVAVAPGGRDVYVAANNSSSVSIFRRDPRRGVLRQRGCVSSGVVGCASGRGLAGAFGVASSPDGRSVYVAAFRGLAVFSRNPATGALSQLPGAEGCVSQDGAAGCTRGRGLASASSVTVAPDGKSVYVASVSSGAVASFARDSRGALRQLGGVDGCVSQGGSEGCLDGRALAGAFSVAVSPTGRHVYVAALNSNALAVFGRDPDSGALDQLTNDDACISQIGSEGCTLGRGLASPNGVSVSPDGRNVYVASSASGAVVALERDAGLGTVFQLPRALGCTSQGGTEGCATGRALGGAFAVTTSLDGANAYAVSSTGVISFVRNPRTGALTEFQGPQVCTTGGGTDRCASGRALQEASSVAITPDGRNAYVASYRSNAVAVFARNPQRARVRIGVRGVPRRCARTTFRARITIRSTLPIQRVRLHLNRRRLGTRAGTRRLTLRMRAGALRPGRHRLGVAARDVGGNIGRRTVSFRRCRT